MKKVNKICRNIIYFYMIKYNNVCIEDSKFIRSVHHKNVLEGEKLPILNSKRVWQVLSSLPKLKEIYKLV